VLHERQYQRLFGTSEDKGEYEMNKELVSTENVEKVFKTKAGAFKALRGVNLKVNEGEFVAIVGPSGSGKSTLLNMITGIDHPTTGEVYVDGERLTEMSENKIARWRGRNVGVVFQFFQLLPTLTVLENVTMPMYYCGSYKDHRIERAMEVLDMVQVADTANQYPSQISGGQQQRAAIARALVNDPKLIVGDEPTGNLDPVSANLIIALFQELVGQGKTIIMVTHSPELTKQIPRVEEVREGRLVTTGEIDNRLTAKS
jgi:putative ABC transport system ATP-binding protein